MTIAFLACVEAGRLEQQGVLLFESLRRYGGRYADARALAFRPRRGPPLDAATLARFDALGVERVDERLNVDFEHYPIANKVLACAWAESRVDADVLVFLDSDTFFCGEPAALDLGPAHDAAVRPVNRKNQGSSGERDKRDAYWQELYRICGVAPGRFCETTVERERIREYWNAGLIAARREAGVFSAWRDDFLRLMAREHVPPNGLNNMDQMALAATLTRVGDRVLVPDGRHNYPLPMRRELGEPLRSAPLEDLVHVHYFRWFHKPGFLRALQPGFSADSEIVGWLEARLPHLPIDDDPGRGKNRDVAGG